MNKKVTAKKLLAPGVMAALLLTPAIAGAATDTTTISSEIAPVVSITTTGAVDVDITPTAAGAQTIASDTVTVSTNNSGGYTLTLSDSDTDTDLESGGNAIAAHGGSQASPTALTANKWGYRVDGVGGFGAGPTTGVTDQAISSAKFAGVPSSASPNTLKTTATTAASDVTTVWYSVAANTSQPSGTYSDVVTYTATAN